MEIKKTIKLNITKSGKNIICDNLATLQMIVGTTGISGNYSYYEIKKEKNKFVVPVEVIQKRIKYMESKIAKLNEYLEIMKQVIK